MVRPGDAAPRPGDAVRAALRRTAGAAPVADTVADPVTVAGSASAEAAEATDADSPGAPTPSPEARPSPPSRTSPPPADTPEAGAPSEAAGPCAPRGGTGSRPGDVAREALRAARAEARQSLAGTGTGTGAGRGTPRGGAGTRPGARAAETRRHRGAADQVADERARAVRELLAGAFQMPSEETAESAPDEAATTSEAGPGTGTASERTTLSEVGPRAEPAPERGTTSEVHPATGTGREALSAPEATSAPEEAVPGRGTEPGLVPGPGAGPGTDPGPDAAPGNTTAAEGGSSRGAAPARFPEDAPSPSAEPSRARRSMGAPARDGDHRRTFPAFPPRTGGSFAGTWWGNAWVTALEEGALDAKRLARGRGYAEQGNVDAITVTPGLVLAYVQGSRPRPYRVQVRLRTLGAEDWERFLEAAVERPGHIAALLDKEMPESLAECGVPLLPGPGDLEPQCSCPDRGHPCKHAAALCYQTARLLDADPFVLLLLRGRGEREVLDALSRRNATRAARAAQEQEPEPLPGVRAAEALAERRLPPLPAPLPVPPHPEQPPAYPSAPNGPDSFALDHLATDAAARAHALLVTGHDEIGELTLWRDAVRLAASRPGSGLTVTTRALYAALASAVGRTPVELARAVAAWRQGGPDGLTVLEETWDPPAGRFDRARPLLLAADLPAFRPRHNHLTHPRGHVQLRFGRDGLWYAYESEPGRDDWWPRGTPDPDPVGALTGLGGSDEF
ncbi:SWIM zinc finger family protein [Streptomyces sp. 3330]|uniref:SWIM zinc finger family protein n=1 Tax=Streptomyces sp. 3330 TaxID=2817755 RepID=UPI00286A9132|nr:SWIM zinc finger family protein [Streptomyces sp. 3330]